VGEGAGACRVGVNGVACEGLHGLDGVHLLLPVGGRQGGGEGPGHGKVAQGGLIGQAVGKVVKVDRGQEVVGAEALTQLLLGRLELCLALLLKLKLKLLLMMLMMMLLLLLLLLLLGEAEAWIRGHRPRGRLICGRGQEGAALDGSEAGTARHSRWVHASAAVLNATRWLKSPKSQFTAQARQSLPTSAWRSPVAARGAPAAPLPSRVPLRCG